VGCVPRVQLRGIGTQDVGRVGFALNSKDKRFTGHWAVRLIYRAGMPDDAADVPDDRAPYFVARGDEFVPGPQAASPWSMTMLHGRLLAGLVARAVELGPAGDVFQVARLTTDLFRAPPMAPVRVETAVVRDGRRVRTADCRLLVEGVEVARAYALLLRRGEQPAGRVWAPPDWSVPSPDELPPPPTTDEPRGFGAPELRMISPEGFMGAGQKLAWLRERRRLVAGEPLTPAARVAMAADVVNPLANWSDQGLAFINADLTVYLVRPPVDEWVGLEVAGHLSQDGVAFGHAILHDRSGGIGHCAVASTATPAMPPV
jgi:Thioesterase-like superfamily